MTMLLNGDEDAEIALDKALAWFEAGYTGYPASRAFNWELIYPDSVVWFFTGRERPCRSSLSWEWRSAFSDLSWRLKELALQQLKEQPVLHWKRSSAVTVIVFVTTGDNIGKEALTQGELESLEHWLPELAVSDELLDQAAFIQERKQALEAHSHAVIERRNAVVYAEGNSWQRDRYAYMAWYAGENKVISYGSAERAGKPYRHLLLEVCAELNFLNDRMTLEEVEQRFLAHKAGDRSRVLSNMVASQPCCFNLFAPLTRHPKLADALFSKLLGEAVEVVHTEIEFTPNKWAGVPGFERTEDESIGDQSERGGTDADVAVFYRTSNGKRGVVLIEFKYIEAEFSTCGSYKSKTKGARIRPGCNSAGWYVQRVAPFRENPPRQPDCGYLKYQNWRLLERSRVLNADAVKRQPGCPFKGSLNQLWRNLLLAERVAGARQLDAFHFWVMSPAQNTYLWKESEGDVFQRMQELLTPFGKPLFRKLELDKDVIAGLDALAKTEEQREWLRRFRGRYLSSTPSAP